MTNDGATILSLLDIEHPAGKILVDLAQQQDREVRRQPMKLKEALTVAPGWRWDNISRSYSCRTSTKSE